MELGPNLSSVAALIADSSRATILTALMDGRMLPASEPARLARITPRTASAHLAKLVEGGLLATESQGRHRYFRIASTEVKLRETTNRAACEARPVSFVWLSNLMTLRNFQMV